MPAATHAIVMRHDEEPKLVIQRETKDFIDGIQPMGARLLVGVYERGEVTKGGIIITETTRKEDRYQGRVGLILKMGPLAFTEDDQHLWPGRKPVIGDWIGFRVGDTSPFALPNSRYCRLVEDVAVQMILSNPDHIL